MGERVEVEADEVEPTFAYEESVHGLMVEDSCTQIQWQRRRIIGKSGNGSKNIFLCG